MINLHTYEIQCLNTFELTTSSPATLLISNHSELIEYISRLTKNERLNLHIAGELSNTILGNKLNHPLILFRDGDFVKIIYKLNTTEVTVSGSFKLDKLVDHLCASDISGLEFLSGIPGTVGGGISQNAAAYGQQISDNLYSLKVLNLLTNSIETIHPKYLRFKYRNSLLKDSPTYSPKIIILEATFIFQNDSIPPIIYKDLFNYHRSKRRELNDLSGRRSSVLEVRNKKGMTVGGTNWLPCAGSFFLSPIVDDTRAQHIVQSIRGSKFAGTFFSWYKPDANHTRIPAALVMRAAGFLNGDKWGSVGLSPHHILAICSHSKNTSGSDVRNLCKLIQNKVKQLFDIELQEEIRLLGSLEETDPDSFLKKNRFVSGIEEPKWVKDLGTP